MAYIEMKHSFKRYQVGDTRLSPIMISFEIEKGGTGHYPRRFWC